MNALELKGIGGDIFGWDGDSATSNAVDSIRFRNFGVNLTNGRGAQVDINYDLNTEAGSMSYSILQALPALGIFNLYPLAGVGAVFAIKVLLSKKHFSSGAMHVNIAKSL